MEQAENEALYVVVANKEEQYSIWPANKDVPRGWKQVGEGKEKDACLNYIRSVWTDMRPKSLRESMRR
jgi:MbtH protein